MKQFDVFNGDADGLCALQQLRLAQPAEAQLITGAKRDNALLARVVAQAGDRVSVLDLPLPRNRAALEDLLARGVAVEYFDHHATPDLPAHPLLHLAIDTAAGVCTSLIVDRHLQGQHRRWAIAGAFGDNLRERGFDLARAAGLAPIDAERLRRVGECLNYNSYGDDESELLFAPAAISRRMRPYADPLLFAEGEDIIDTIDAQRVLDMEQAFALQPHAHDEDASVFVLPAAPWARRVLGAFANELVARSPQRAHAVLVPDRDGRLGVSLRVPEGRTPDADGFARRWGGGGRRTAAGIDDLEPARTDELVRAFIAAYASG